MIRVSFLAASSIVPAACKPVPQTLTGGRSGSDTTSRILPPEGALSVSDKLDGIVRNASYVGDLEKRVYLLSAPHWPEGASGAMRDVVTLGLCDGTRPPAIVERPALWGLLVPGTFTAPTP